jgi:hypothetical protein
MVLGMQAKSLELYSTVILFAFLFMDPSLFGYYRFFHAIFLLLRMHDVFIYSVYN